jgi:DNA-binding transcriptional MerR regulator/effector-binding domain-containing protein
MRDLVPSGRFAQLARLTRKQLRLYAEQGLLRPVYTDPNSGYHYYSLSQLDEAHRIAHLRELGMSLDTIQSTLRAWHTPNLRAQLEEHRAQLEQQEAAVRKAISELDRLLKTERPGYAISTKRVLPQCCLSMRQCVPPQKTCTFIDEAEPALLKALKVSIAKPAGSLIVRYHDAGQDDAWDVEVCQPFEGDLYPPLPEGMSETELPGGTAAFTVHAGDTGGDFGMQPAYEALWSWAREHGHDTFGPPYEVYLFDETNTASVADYRTEIGWLIA